MADLAGQLGIAAEAITVRSVEAVEWPDASLGCPKPGMMYAQVITPGYRIVLEANGQSYEYHAGRSGRAYAASREAPVSYRQRILSETPSGGSTSLHLPGFCD